MTKNENIEQASDDCLAKFNAAGGHVFSDGSMGFYVLGNSEENQDEARSMIRKIGGNGPNNTVQ